MLAENLNTITMYLRDGAQMLEVLPGCGDPSWVVLRLTNYHDTGLTEARIHLSAAETAQLLVAVILAEGSATLADMSSLPIIAEGFRAIAGATPNEALSVRLTELAGALESLTLTLPEQPAPASPVGDAGPVPEPSDTTPTPTGEGDSGTDTAETPQASVSEDQAPQAPQPF